VFLPIFAASSSEISQFQDLTRPPDAISASTETGSIELQYDHQTTWRSDEVTVKTRPKGGGLLVELTAPNAAVRNLQLRWNVTFPPDWKYLGDAWERGYGDLQWKLRDDHRVMPWYFLASNGNWTHGCGVKTGAAAFCHWMVDATGITLHADVRCGGLGVQLGSRQLDVCTVVCRRGVPKETPFAAAQAFCGEMCAHPRLPRQPVYGFNDWYCAYGKDTADEFLKNAGYMVSLAPAGGVRPFAVVDDGWEENAKYSTRSNLWSQVNPKFSTTLSMAEFAKRIRALGARPGLWCRPVIATPDCPANWRLARDADVLDPTVPEVRVYVANMMARFHDWGFDLIKHDFSTFDLLGYWGTEMNGEVTTNGWAFADRSLTSAEVISRLYSDIRKSAGKDTLIIGCNTVGHLAAGYFEMQRIGDDTSGRNWDRIRKMGVNSLASRAPQHGKFFAADADCAGQTTANSLPWQKNSQWLYLLAHSGTVLFTSFPRDILNAEQEEDLRQALAAAARPQPLAEPLDWMEQARPRHWRLDGKNVDFNW
jgi:alpha-galactosidase